MFFVRTQQEHDWRSPQYKFTRPQFRAFARLMEEAKRVVDEGQSQSGEEAGEDGVEVRGEREESAEEGSAAQGGGSAMTPIQMACLDFCIQLLNQEVMYSEYESAMVCGLAVLGISELGWKETDTYP